MHEENCRTCEAGLQQAIILLFRRVIGSNLHRFRFAREVITAMLRKSCVPFKMFKDAKLSKVQFARIRKDIEQR